jgi:large subunit ribosomal protein L4
MILPKKVRALALRHALSAKAKADGMIIVLDDAKSGSQDQGAYVAVRQAEHLSNALIIDGARSNANFASRRAQHSASMCCRCRASTSTTSCAPKAGADQGGG